MRVDIELIKKIASDSVIDFAYDWLYDRRKKYPHNDDVWDLRFRWAEIKPHLQRTVFIMRIKNSSRKTAKNAEVKEKKER